MQDGTDIFLAESVFRTSLPDLSKYPFACRKILRVAEYVGFRESLNHQQHYIDIELKHMSCARRLIHEVLQPLHVCVRLLRRTSLLKLRRIDRGKNHFIKLKAHQCLRR